MDLRMRQFVLIAVAIAASLVDALSAASAATYAVGPGRGYATLPALFAAVDLEPGDLVEVDGDTVYPGGIIWPANDGGAPGNPVIVRGLRVNGAQPTLSGGTNTIEIRANHVVFEGFEVTGGTFRCVFHHSHDVVIRDAWIHHCPAHGVLGADQDSGSLTIEYSEISHAGGGTTQHAIYMATDEVTYPGAVFRLQHSYVHTGTGGNLIKSRAERNEIYYNWIEGAVYHELELIGPDPNGAKPGWTAALAREDSDVVGNVIVHTSTTFGAVMRLGGDATGESHGRYRIVNNTILRLGHTDTPTIFRLFDGIESVEMHNNLIWRDGGHALRVVREVEAVWASGQSRITGSNNAFVASAVFVPPGWSQSRLVTGADFSDVAARELHLAADSPLHDLGSTDTSTAPLYDIADAEFPPRFHPARMLQAVGSAQSRPSNGAGLDLGAFETADPSAVFRNGFEG
jgi:hypothetical protein